MLTVFILYITACASSLDCRTHTYDQTFYAQSLCEEQALRERLIKGAREARCLPQSQPLPKRG